MRSTGKLPAQVGNLRVGTLRRESEARLAVARQAALARALDALSPDQVNAVLKQGTDAIDAARRCRIGVFLVRRHMGTNRHGRGRPAGWITERMRRRVASRIVERAAEAAAGAEVREALAGLILQVLPVDSPAVDALQTNEAWVAVPLHPSDAPRATTAPARGPNSRFPDNSSGNPAEGLRAVRGGC